MGSITVVLGASPNPDRYSNMAVHRLIAHGHAVRAVGRRQGSIGDTPIHQQLSSDLPVDTVTLYLNAGNQKEWEAAILALRPRRIIFNPGAENPDLAVRAEASGIQAVEGCTLVMLAAGTY